MATRCPANDCERGRLWTGQPCPYCVAGRIARDDDRKQAQSMQRRVDEFNDASKKEGG